MKNSIIFGAFGNYGLIAVAMVLVCTGLNAVCIWMGIFGLIMSVMCAIGALLGGAEIVRANNVKNEHVYFILACLLGYLFAVVVEGWFFVALLAVILLWGQMWWHRNEDVNLYVLCVVSYALGVEFSFMLMGDEIPANEMYVEYLAGAAVLVTWLFAAVQSRRSFN